MEHEKAIDILKRLRIATATSNIDGERILEPLSMGIEALEKQIPKKPNEHYNWGDLLEDEKKENSRWFCVECFRDIEESYSYCPYCGQKLAWD